METEDGGSDAGADCGAAAACGDVDAGGVGCGGEERRGRVVYVVREAARGKVMFAAVTQRLSDVWSVSERRVTGRSLLPAAV